MSEILRDEIGGKQLKLAQRHRIIKAGQFNGTPRIDLEFPHPGVITQLVIDFITTGVLIKQSTITCQFPDHGWGPVVSTVLNTTIKLPVGVPVPLLKTYWCMESRTLEFSILQEPIPENTRVILLVSGIHTPPAATPASEAIVTTYEKIIHRSTVPASIRGGQIVDGPTAFPIPRILPGQCSGALEWKPCSRYPDIVDTVSVSFISFGAIPPKGKIRIELPINTWSMKESPQVLLQAEKSIHTEVPTLATWDHSQGVLEAVIPGDLSLPMKSKILLTILDVKNPPPPSFRYTIGDKASHGRIITLTNSGGVIDGPCQLLLATISELKDSDFELAKEAWDRIDTEHKGVLELNQLHSVWHATHIFLSDSMYNSLILPRIDNLNAAHLLPTAADISNQQANASEALLHDNNDAKEVITKEGFLYIFGTIYAPAYKRGQELRVACSRAHLAQMEELIRCGCNRNAKDAKGWGPLHYAADYGHLDAVKLLHQLLQDETDALNVNIHQLDINSRDASGWTPLMCAAANGHVDIVSYLLDCGADATTQSVQGRNALHWACSCGMHACIPILIASGININQQDACGWTPLHCSLLHGSTKCTKLLIGAGADSKILDVLKYSPLQYGEIDVAIDY